MLEVSNRPGHSSKPLKLAKPVRSGIVDFKAVCKTMVIYCAGKGRCTVRFPGTLWPW